ncbi:restriction endonuclease [Sinorhizobium meliloti]|uniref:restriction endonuclease n=1 Tax=Rhizobium meliloti TaxID=382 RepID=UPI003D662334
MQEGPDDLARLIHEALEELAWKADAEQVAEIVRRLNVGLPAEDEFMVVSNWLGKCNMIHKLDQHLVPMQAREKYQVPDLLARYSTQSNATPVLIEVKAKQAKTLSFQPGYLTRLQAYAEMMAMPLLIAWKFHSIWMLFEPRHMKKAKKNFNISLSDAMRENLFGILAGDFAFKVAHGAGAHLCFRKEKLLSTIKGDDTFEETWQTRCVAVTFTGRGGSVAEKVSPEVQTLLATWDLETTEEHDEDHIWIRHTAPSEGMRFSHSALVSLLNWGLPQGESISWREQLRTEKINTIADFRSATVKGLEEGIVHLIVDQQPHTWPDFVRRTQAA